MTTDTKLQELIINKLTTSQYASIEEKDPNQIYIVTDAENLADGVVEKNQGGVKYDWVGTIAEYYEQKIEENHPDWICYITDDSEKTNCLTHIPQDIKLELNDGTLTAKQGSKVWIPYGTTEAYKVGDIDAYGHTVVATSWDGAKFFYAIELGSDISNTRDYNAKSLVIFGYATEGVQFWVRDESFSGSTAPTGVTYMLWYDTENNYVKTTGDGGSTWNANWALPLAETTVSGGKITSIDQTFNGFGYIGSTIFALPGVKGLIPNGRNADGSLRNVEFTVDKVLTRTFTSAIGEFTGYAAFQTTGSGVSLSYDALNYWSYNSAKNIFEAPTETTGFCYFANMATDSSGRITAFTPKLPFHAVDRNDSSWLSGLGMPSGKYIDLTLLASGSSYTAPANGYFRANIAKDGYVMLYGSTLSGYNASISAGGCSIAVQKGEGMTMFYSGTVTSFRFVYAKGETV